MADPPEQFSLDFCRSLIDAVTPYLAGPNRNPDRAVEVLHRRLKQIRDAQLAIRDARQSTRRAEPRALHGAHQARREPEYRIPPAAIVKGLAAANRLCRRAAEALARGGRVACRVDGEAVQATVAGVHDLAADALYTWALDGVAGRSPVRAFLVPGLSPTEALTIGLLRRLDQQPEYRQRRARGGRSGTRGRGDRTQGRIEWARRYGAPDADRLLGPAGDEIRRTLARPLAALVARLAESPFWRTRVRRCGHCHIFFADRSPAGDKWACCPEHAVRVTERFGARISRWRRAR